MLKPNRNLRDAIEGMFGVQVTESSTASLDQRELSEYECSVERDIQMAKGGEDSDQGKLVV